MSLSTRIRKIEKSYSFRLLPKTPAILRLDGRAFSNFTRTFNKPFDDNLLQSFQYTALKLCENTPTSKFAYCQSDEISILLIDYSRDETEPFFDGNIQKIVSVCSGMASNFFNQKLSELYSDETIKFRPFSAHFDARIFSIPVSEVHNYFICRQRNAYNNAICSMSQTIKSPKQLQGMSVGQQHDMIQKENPSIFTQQNIQYYLHGSVIKKIKKSIISENSIEHTREKFSLQEKTTIFSSHHDYFTNMLLPSDKE